MDEKGIREADILGFSDGGNVALLFALKHPGMVRRLILNGADLFSRRRETLRTDSYYYRLQNGILLFPF